MKNIILTGDRPTGKLHIGHYVGSIKKRLKLMNEGNYDEMYIMIADSQALTDNFDNPEKIRENLYEVALDYLSCGINPEKVTIFIQSMIPELTEYTFYFQNLVTLSRLERNPTIKSEIEMRGFNDSIPAGFLTYPISQAADITLFNTTLVPAGIDQEPMIEQTNEIVRKFNNLYGNTLKECKILLPENDTCRRLPGTDGKAKMSKSLGNCIYLSDDEKTLHDKVFSMYTDPNHIKITDSGNVEGNTVFTYLDCFVKEDSFIKYLPEYNNLDELKNHYKKGGLGDVKIKKFLFEVLNEELKPIRERRIELSKDMDYVKKVLISGTEKARIVAKTNIEKFKKSLRINYFE